MSDFLRNIEWPWEIAEKLSWVFSPGKTHPSFKSLCDSTYKSVFVVVFVVQSLSYVQLFATPGTAAHQASLSFTISQSLLIRVHWISDAIQSSYPLSSLSPHALNLSQHQSLFQSVGSSYQVAKVLKLQFQHQSFQWIFRVDFLSDWLVLSPCHPWYSQESSLASQFKSINSSASALCGL